MIRDVRAVADAYFAAVMGADAKALREVFADDAELVTVGGTFHGPDQIAGFYERAVFVIEDLEPRPGPYVIDGDRLAVEIDLRLNSQITRVADFFTITAGKIKRLAVYMGPSRA